jgi:RNA polymerase sigma-70 factor (ECF subfamily)
MKSSKQGINPVDAAKDNGLMEQVRDGKVEKMAILFERYHVLLFNFFLRLTGNRSVSEDLVQEVFIRMLKYRHTYQGRNKFTVWMYQIARNAHIDYLRKKKQEFPLDDQWEEATSREPAPSEQLEQANEIAFVRDALAKLSLKKREVLVLSRYQNLKYREIAELFGCQVGYVKTLVHRAIKDLRQHYYELSGGMVQ